MIKYSSPLFQVIIVGKLCNLRIIQHPKFYDFDFHPYLLLSLGVVCFLTSGMFNALNGMGGGGQLDTRVASNANVALYTCFAVGGLIAGPIVNKLGPSLSLVLGGSTYALYSG